MEPAMFSVANMFGSESGDDDDDDDDTSVERDHTFPGLILRIREFSFHQVNANLLWPGASIFAEWIVDHKELFAGRRVLELGSGTGALAIFLKKTLGLDITTSDYDDVEIENNITKNCQLNGLATLPHIRHTWGEDFPHATPDWDLIIASDILLYVKQYPSLVQTLSYLLKGYKVDISPAKQNAHATDSFVLYSRGDHRSGSSIQGSAKENSDVVRGGSCEAVAGSLCNPSKLTPSVGSDCRIETVSSALPFSEKVSVDSRSPGATIQAPTLSCHLPSPPGICLPIPCFLMSWRRRIPKQDEAIFFDGCKSAGLNVMDFGSRIYCIH